MNSFPLYKKRDFNDLFSDTLSFGRFFFKNLFRNFLIINGPLVLSFVILILGVVLRNFNSVENIFTDSFSTELIITLLVMGLLFLLLLFFIFCFPLVHIMLVEENPTRKDFEAYELLTKIKTITPRLFAFFLYSIFIIGIPYIIIYVLASLIPILNLFAGFIISPVFTIIFSQASFYYVKDKMGFFPSLEKTYDKLRIDFWSKIGATLVINLLCSLLVAVIIIIPTILTILFFVFGVAEGLDISEHMISLFVTGILWAGIIILILFISNIQNITQMMIYYSSEEERILQDELEQIGKNNF